MKVNGSKITVKYASPVGKLQSAVSALKAKEVLKEKQYRESVEEIAVNIENLGKQVSSILNGRLQKESIITLLAYSTRMSRGDLGMVLDALANLEKTHLKKITPF